MKTNLTEITKTYFGSVFFFTVAGEGAMLLADSYRLVREPSYLLPIVAGCSIPALVFGINLGARALYLSRPPTPNAGRPAYTAMASQAAWVARQPKSPPGGWFFGGGAGGRTIKYEPAPREPFIFWEAGMESQITEDLLFSFCRLAWRRQQHVKFGDLAANKIFSRKYFTQEARPKYPLPEYNSILHILTTRNLIINRWSGKGGELHYPAYSTLLEAKMRFGFKPEKKITS